MLDNKICNEISVADGKIADLGCLFKEFKEQSETNFESDNERIQVLQAKAVAITESVGKRDKEINDRVLKISEMREKDKEEIIELKNWAEDCKEGVKVIKQTIKTLAEQVQKAEVRLYRDPTPKVLSTPSSESLENGYYSIAVQVSAPYSEIKINEKCEEAPYEENDEKIIHREIKQDTKNMDKNKNKKEKELKVTTSEFENRIQILQKDIENIIEESKNSITKEVNSIIESLAPQQNNPDKNIKMIQELQDKLAWLPMDLTLLKGMSPIDARLLTVEARMRTEENTRTQAFEYLLSLIQSLIPSNIASPILEESSPCLETLADENSQFNKNLEKKTTPGGMATSGWWKANCDSSKRIYKENESISGKRVKYSTPVPELENSLERLSKPRTKKRNNPYYKVTKLDMAKLPRIQSSISSQNSYTKTQKL